MRGHFSRLTLHALALLLHSAFPVASHANPVSDRPVEKWNADVVADHLSYPWDVNHDSGVFVITEASGHIAMIEDGRLRRFVAHTTDQIVQDGGSGLLGMALAEDFAITGLAYAYHTYRSGPGLANKVVELRFDGSEWRELRTLLSGIPGHPLYNGGRVGIEPDGHIYVTTGWVEDRAAPQDIRCLAGKVLRLRRDGRVPADNPFRGSYVYSYGHRNPQGLAWDRSGALYVAEHGQTARDEINRILPGANYGWPLVIGDGAKEGLELPTIHSGGDTWAPSGIAFAGDDLLVATLAARSLQIWNRMSGTLERVFTSGDRLRDVIAVGQDLYVVTTNRSPRAQGPSWDRLIKLSRPATP